MADCEHRLAQREDDDRVNVWHCSTCRQRVKLDERTSRWVDEERKTVDGLAFIRSHPSEMADAWYCTGCRGAVPCVHGQTPRCAKCDAAAVARLEKP